ncbi:MAG: anaerobic ribonucleoside-triphosphate reductase activating protein [Patescibacteria group bacterium]|jgi:pyruvate formate lyase activating enzyme|nr:anaerobic ribonucleoside-triphosphate reductase activating protein [Patescibacteria group bacterium]
MIIGGLEKLSTLDYPNHLAAIVFTFGCNFRCKYCYNPLLVCPKEDADDKNNEGLSQISDKDLLLFLKERYGKLDGVVITGGEPTLHDDLPEFIKKIKDIGYDVKLDSNGTNPKMLKTLINSQLIDYIAMDLKAPLLDYEKVVAVKTNFQKLKESAKIIMSSGIPYEFRTTLVPGLADKDDIEEMGKSIKGAEKWYFQKFKSDTPLVDPKYGGKKSFTDKEMKEFVKIGQKFVDICEFRG